MTETRTTLDSLPSDIIQSILDWLPLERPSIGETRPVRYESLIPGEDWHTFTRNRRGLVSLCRVSKRFPGYAQPLLYRTVAIVSESSLVLFFRTISEQPALGRSFTRFFSCHLTLTTATRKVREALQQYCPTYADIYRFDTTSTLRDVTPESVLAYILIRLPRLDTLLLQVPIWNDACNYQSLMRNLSMLSSTSWCQDCADLGFWPSCYQHNDPGRERQPLLPSVIPLPRDCPFTQLETLMIQGDPEMRQFIEDENPDSAEYWGICVLHYAPMFFISPKLHTLEICSDDGNLDFGYFHTVCLPDLPDDLTYHDLPYLFEMFRHIYLHDSVACPRALHCILRHAPNLETLYMTPRFDEDLVNEWDPERYEGMGCLDVCLAKDGKKLRHLDVGWFDHYDYPEMIGENGRLASLPRLTNLETLCVQLVVLYGTDPAGLLMPLASLLPPNLVQLTLVDWWWSDIDAYEEMQDWRAAEKTEHYRSKTAYRSNALGSLMHFAQDYSQPRLKKVMLTCPIPWTWMMEAGVGLDFHFGEVKEAFAKRGVEFLVDEA